MQYSFSQTRGPIINLFGYPILPTSICCLGLILISQSLINWREMLANIGFNFVLTTDVWTQTTTQVHWQTSINAKDIEFFVVNKCNAYSDWKLDLGGTTYLNEFLWTPSNGSLGLFMSATHVTIRTLHVLPDWQLAVF